VNQKKQAKIKSIHIGHFPFPYFYTSTILSEQLSKYHKRSWNGSLFKQTMNNFVYNSKTTIINSVNHWH